MINCEWLIGNSKWLKTGTQFKTVNHVSLRYSCVMTAGRGGSTFASL